MQKGAGLCGIPEEPPAAAGDGDAPGFLECDDADAVGKAAFQSVVAEGDDGVAVYVLLAFFRGAGGVGKVCGEGLPRGGAGGEAIHAIGFCAGDGVPGERDFVVVQVGAQACGRAGGVLGGEVGAAGVGGDIVVAAKVGEVEFRHVEPGGVGLPPRGDAEEEDVFCACKGHLTEGVVVQGESVGRGDVGRGTVGEDKLALLIRSFGEDGDALEDVIAIVLPGADAGVGKGKACGVEDKEDIGGGHGKGMVAVSAASMAGLRGEGGEIEGGKGVVVGGVHEAVGLGGDVSEEEGVAAFVGNEVFGRAACRGGWRR